MALAERQQSHRHALERAESRNRWRLVSIGQLMAFILALIGMGGGLVLVWHEKNLAGLPLFLTTLTGLVGVYVYYHRNLKPGEPGEPGQGQANQNTDEAKR